MLLAFILAALITVGLVVWQLVETTPRAWCQLAADANEARYSSCSSILIKLLDIKDHTIIGLLSILGIIILAIVVVALGVSVKGTGPGGIGVDIGSDKTRVTDGESVVDIPTPPSGA